MLYRTGLKRMVVVAAAAVVVLPLFSVFFVVPRFQSFLSAETRRQAELVAAHLAGYLSADVRSGYDLVADPAFVDEIGAIRSTLGIWRVKVFSLDGRLLYSSDPGDRAGGDPVLFPRVVRTGRAASAMVEKDIHAPGGRRRAWLVETYVPLVNRGTAIGVFEIYKDVTRARATIRRIALFANLGATAVGVVLLLFLVVVTRRVLREMDGRERLLAERRRMEREVAERSRAEAISTLTAGISHDFNNILTAVMAHLNIARMQADPDGDIYKSLDEAERAALIARDLTRQLMVIARPEPAAACACDTRRLIEAAAPVSGGRPRVEVDMDLSPDLPRVMVDRDLVVQALQAVIVNAGQVSKEGVPVEVTAAAVEVGDGEVKGLAAGSYVRVSIRDSGPGIPPEIMERIFDPYFTTRDRDSSRGVGLGLSFCRSVIERHGGAVTVESGSDGGAVFHVYLPVCGENGGAG